jgi:hypothetical protein
VELLGGDPTGEEAKQASRSKRAVELVEAGTHTQTEAAREVGITRQAVHKQDVSTKSGVTRKMVDRVKPLAVVRLTKDHQLAAEMILRHTNADYARELASHLNMLAVRGRIVSRKKLDSQQKLEKPRRLRRLEKSGLLRRRYTIGSFQGKNVSTRKSLKRQQELSTRFVIAPDWLKPQQGRQPKAGIPPIG